MITEDSSRSIAPTNLAEAARIPNSAAFLMTLLDRLSGPARFSLAADIHDDSVQAMIAADLKLEALRQKVTCTDDLRMISDIQESVRAAASRLRALIFELAPEQHDLSLEEMIRLYLEASMANINAFFKSSLKADVRPETKHLAFQIAREALTNIQRHSGAKNVWVELSQADGGLLVRITDDGCGLAGLSPKPGHLGLAAMRHRAQNAGGWLKIRSNRGTGTTITYWLGDSDPDGAVAGQRIRRGRPLRSAPGGKPPKSKGALRSNSPPI